MNMYLKDSRGDLHREHEVSPRYRDRMRRVLLIDPTDADLVGRLARAFRAHETDDHDDAAALRDALLEVAATAASATREVAA